jgi:4-hydroxy-3-polyprenylbenzoate decarboxylase
MRTELGLEPDVSGGRFVPADFGMTDTVLTDTVLTDTVLTDTVLTDTVLTETGLSPWWQRLSSSPPPPLASPRQAESPILLYDVRDLLSPIASGSHLTRGMVICPCSGSTLSAVAHAVGTNLIHRAAEVHLKERRRLVLVPRETPLSTPMLENMAAVSRYGATVLPASPGWYHGVNSLFDLIDFVVARILDQFHIPHRLTERWGADSEES